MNADRGSAVRTISAFFPENSRALRAAQLLFEAGVPRSSVRMVTGGEEASVTGFDEWHQGGPHNPITEFFIPDEKFEDKSREQNSSLTVSDLPPELHARAVLILENEGAAVEKRETPH